METPNASGEAVFQLSAAALQSARNLVFSGSAGTIVIDVTGNSFVDATTFNASAFLNEHVIWNFATATSLSFQGWHGSVLAPDATVSNSSAMEGFLYADDFQGGGEPARFPIRRFGPWPDPGPGATYDPRPRRRIAGARDPARPDAPVRSACGRTDANWRLKGLRPIMLASTGRWDRAQMSSGEEQVPVPASSRMPAVRHEGAVTIGAVAVGALALGAVAVGALAIGKLAVGQLAMTRAKLRKGQVGELRISRLIVQELRIDRRDF